MNISVNFRYPFTKKITGSPIYLKHKKTHIQNWLEYMVPKCLLVHFKITRPSLNISFELYPSIIYLL